MAPGLGESEEEVLAFPGSETADHTDDRFVVAGGDPGSEGTPGLAAVAFEGDAVVDGGEAMGGQSFAEEGLAGEVGDGDDAGGAAAGLEAEGAAGGPGEEIGGEDVIHPPDRGDVGDAAGGP